MTDRYRYNQSSSLSDLGDRIRARQSSYSSPSTSSNRYYSPPPTYSPFGSSSRASQRTRPEVSSYFTDNDVVSGNVRVPRQDLRASSDIGSRIRNTVAERQGRGYGAYTPPGYEDVRNRVSGAPSHQSIFDSVRSRVNPDVMTGLGDMIRNRAQGGATSQLGGIPGIAPGQRPEPPTLSNVRNAFDMGQSIRDRVMGGIGGQQQPSIPNDPRNLGVPQQSSDGSWGMDQGGYEDAAAPPQGSLTPGQGQQPPPTEPMPPMDPEAPAQPGAGSGTPGQLGSYGNASIDQWDSAFIAAYEATGVDPHLLKAMAEIESGGRGDIPLNECRDDGTGIPSCGLMQVKPEIWGYVNSTEEQIMQAAEILADAVNSGQYATHRDALFGIYFPSDDPNGTTQGIYDTRVDELMRIMGPYVPGGNVGAPLPAGGEVTGALPDGIDGGMAGAPVQGRGEGMVPTGDIAASITGGYSTNADIGYGFRAPASDPAMYSKYGPMWPDPSLHPGADIHGAYGEPFSSGEIYGEVTCAGSSDIDAGSEGWGCTAFPHNGPAGESGRSGRIEVYNRDNGITYIFGHAEDVWVNVGDYIEPGTILGDVGWDHADGTGEGHVHLEARVFCPGMDYPLLVDPILAAHSKDGVADFCP